ncbi:hypothetical protein GNP88_21110, partial [Aliivibrio fischeri]|nr:hypothetical protein [Aliivibrio fischeri]
ATGVTEGIIAVEASKDSIESNTANVTVTSAVLKSIQVTPANPTMAKGNAVQLIAQGMYSDGSSVDISSSVAWTSSNTDIVTVTADGL